MYSVVMMMALTTGADMPACHRNRGCDGGCSGYVAVACYGGGCSGVAACSGGRRHRWRHGCSGGCYGGYVCCGAVISTGCAGSYGCSGAVYGGSGGVMAPGGMYYGTPGMSGPGNTLPMPSPGKGKGGKKGAPTTQAQTTGTIVVSLPAGARLTVDGRATASRLFVTPDLEPGYEYYYTLRAEVIRDGRTIAQTQHVAVHRGAQTPVAFDFASEGVASNR